MTKFPRLCSELKEKKHVQHENWALWIMLYVDEPALLGCSFQTEHVLQQFACGRPGKCLIAHLMRSDWRAPPMVTLMDLGPKKKKKKSSLKTSCRTVTGRWRWIVKQQGHIRMFLVLLPRPPKYHQPFPNLIPICLEFFLMLSTGQHDDITRHFFPFHQKCQNKFHIGWQRVRLPLCCNKIVSRRRWESAP